MEVKASAASRAQVAFRQRGPSRRACTGVAVAGRRRWQRARLLEVLEPSMDRIPPAAATQPSAEGVSIRPFATPRRSNAKARQVRENLSRIAGVSPPEPLPPLPAPDAFGYRNKMEFSFSTRPWDPDGVPTQPLPEPALGLHVRGRFDGVFDVHDCALVDPEVNRLLALIRDFARARSISAFRGEARAGSFGISSFGCRATQGSGWSPSWRARSTPTLDELAQLCVGAHPESRASSSGSTRAVATVARPETEILLHGRDRIVERLGGLEFELSAASFFQTNSAAAEGLVHELRAMTPPVHTLLDLYCGVGTLGFVTRGLLRGARGGRVGRRPPSPTRAATPPAIGSKHARFEVGAAEEWFTQAKRLNPGAVVIDPPRAGLHRRRARQAWPARTGLGMSDLAGTRPLVERATSSEGNASRRVRAAHHVETIAGALRRAPLAMRIARGREIASGSPVQRWPCGRCSPRAAGRSRLRRVQSLRLGEPLLGGTDLEIGHVRSDAGGVRRASATAVSTD